MSAVKVKAIRVGQHGGILRSVDEVFMMDTKVIIDGEFPTWVVPLEEYKVPEKKEAAKKAIAKKSDGALKDLM